MMTTTLILSVLCITTPRTFAFTNSAERILRRHSAAYVTASSTVVHAEFNLLFDCDGVLADTERDGHRVAFNKAFVEKGIVEDENYWTVELYGKLLETGGGKERMTAHWNTVGWPAGYEDREAQQELVKSLHLRKTELFNEMITAGQIPLRPGVLRLVDEAIEAGVPLGVCSTSNEKAVTNIVETLMGPERRAKFQIFAGDVVEKKKPSPDIYLLAKDTMGLDAARTMVIEDSHIGLRAAKGAGMNCVVTKSSYTAGEDFQMADAIVPELGDNYASGVTLEKLMRIPGQSS